MCKLLTWYLTIITDTWAWPTAKQTLKLNKEYVWKIEPMLDSIKDLNLTSYLKIIFS
jgi:hypothetical protein